MAYLVASGSAFSVAANAKSAEQVSGTYQFVGPGSVILIAKASATGLNHTCTVGGVPLVNDLVIPFTGTAGTISAADNMVVAAAVAGGKVEYTLRNTTGGAITADYQILWEPGAARRR